MSEYCAGGSTIVLAQLISFPFSMANESVTDLPDGIQSSDPPRSPDDCSHAHLSRGASPAWPNELCPSRSEAEVRPKGLRCRASQRVVRPSDSLTTLFKGVISESTSGSARVATDSLHSFRQLLESLLSQGMLILIWVQKLSQPPKVLYRLLPHHLLPKGIRGANLHSCCQGFYRCLNEFVDDKDLFAFLRAIIIAFIRFQVIDG